MLVVLPFHSGDKTQAVSLANWIRELGQVSEHKALICLGEHCDETGVIEPLRECFGSVSAFRPNAKVSRGEGKMGYARAANAMWQSVAWKIYFQDKSAWLWLEPDAIPTRPSWLREIETEYRAYKKPFMGAMGQAQIAMLNGVAVYPPNVCDFAPLALQAGDCPWDLNAAPQILKHAHVSDLFQHVYQIKGEAPTFPKDKDKLTNAALFHRNKDGTLIAYLKEHGYTKPYRDDRFNIPHPEHGVAIIEQVSGEINRTNKVAELMVPPSVREDDSEMMGDSVDYALKLEEEARKHPVQPRVPNEGDRLGELVWRGGKWHTAADVVEPSKANRAAVMEKYKHPKEIPQQQTHEEVMRSGTSPSEAGSAEPPEGPGRGGNKPLMRNRNASTDGDTPSRDELVKDAVAVLKSLCTSPRATSMVRKELKKQKVMK